MQVIPNNWGQSLQVKVDILSRLNRFMTTSNIIRAIFAIAIVCLIIAQIMSKFSHKKEMTKIHKERKEESLRLQREYFDLKGLVSEEALRSRDMKFLAGRIRKFQSKYSPSLVYKISNAIYKNANAHDNLSVSFVSAVITAESAFDYRAVSKRWDKKRQKWVVIGAEGLMQLMPVMFSIYKRAHRLKGSSFDIHNNMVAGCNHLSDLIGQFKNLRHAIVAYNAGEGYTRYWLSHGGNFKMLIDEPKEYVLKVMDFYKKYRSVIGGDIRLALR